MDLSKKDRLIIANQLKILEKLYPEEAEYYAQHRTAVEHGYKLQYSSMIEHIYDEMSEEECTEVLDILDMHWALHIAYQDLEDKSEIDEQSIRFRGFDGNNETNKMAYTRYFILDLDRFEGLKYGQEYPDFNSHGPTIDRYRRMLNIWQQCPDKYSLTKEEIKRIARAE